MSDGERRSPELTLASYRFLNHLAPSSIRNAELGLLDGVSSSSCDISESLRVQEGAHY